MASHTGWSVRAAVFSSIALSCTASQAAPPPGAIDVSFGVRTESFDIGGNLRDNALAMAAAAQGRLLVAGTAETDAGPCLALARFDASGALDVASFGPDTQGINRGLICHQVLSANHVIDSSDMDLLTLEDGGFLVAGMAKSVLKSPFVCRFNANGTPHETFGTYAGCASIGEIDANEASPAPAVMVSAGNVFLVSNTKTTQGRTPVLARLDLATGSPIPFGDKIFLRLLHGAPQYDAFAFDAALADDGDVLLAGHMKLDPDNTDAFVARFDMQTVAPDPTFGGNGFERVSIDKVTDGLDQFTAMSLLPDGRVFAAGRIQTSNGFALVAMAFDQTTGDLSSTFNDGAPYTVEACTTFDLVQCNDTTVSFAGNIEGRPTVVGSGRRDNARHILIARFNSAGELDMGFGSRGIVITDLLGTQTAAGASGFVAQPDGIVLSATARATLGTDFALLRLSDSNEILSDGFESLP